MIFKLYFSSDEDIVLPLSYHHIVQGLIYHMISYNEQYSDFLHNKGRTYGNASFKLFTFGPLNGAYTVNTHKRTINFHNKVNLEIRSPDLFFCDTLSNVLANIHDVTLGKNLITLDYYEIGTCDYIPSKIKIKMLSPLVVYHSFENKTYYHDPLDEDYAGYINRNFIKKFLAVFGEMPPSSIKLTPLAIGLKDKYVTTFKRNTYITGWKGIYLLEGDPECLKYVYECGLGSKNSQGFGMFEIISEVTTH